MAKAHVSERKKNIVSRLVQLIDEYPIIGAINMANLPTKQLQNIRASIREDAVVMMAKRRLIKIAFKQSKKAELIEQLVPYLEGMPALLFTKENPFKLVSKLDANKSTAPAKAGQVAPKNIGVSAGPTGFSPGPIISQLAKFRIKTGIEGGKIVIKEDATVIKKGETISEELAGILLRLKIEPMEIGLNLTAVFEDGAIFSKDVLTIDVKDYENRFRSAAGGAFNVAMFVAYPSKDTIQPLISKAAGEAKALAYSQDILTSDNVGELLAKAFSQMSSVAGTLPEDIRPSGLASAAPVEAAPAPAEAEAKKEEPKEEKKTADEAAAGLGSLFG